MFYFVKKVDVIMLKLFYFIFNYSCGIQNGSLVLSWSNLPCCILQEQQEPFIVLCLFFLLYYLPVMLAAQLDNDIRVAHTYSLCPDFSSLSGGFKLVTSWWPRSKCSCCTHFIFLSAQPLSADWALHTKMNVRPCDLTQVCVCVLCDLHAHPVWAAAPGQRRS